MDNAFNPLISLWGLATAHHLPVWWGRVARGDSQPLIKSPALMRLKWCVPVLGEVSGVAFEEHQEERFRAAYRYGAGGGRGGEGRGGKEGRRGCVYTDT